MRRFCSVSTIMGNDEKCACVLCCFFRKFSSCACACLSCTNAAPQDLNEPLRKNNREITGTPVHSVIFLSYFCFLLFRWCLRRTPEK